MPTDIGSSEARRRFSWLIRRLETNVKGEYRIRSHDRVVARLRRPRPPLNSGEAILRAAAEINRFRRPRRKTRRESVSENYKEILYGKNGILDPGRRS